MKKINVAHSFLADNTQMTWPNGVHIDTPYVTTKNKTPNDRFFNNLFTWDNNVNKCSLTNIPVDEQYVFPIYIECREFWESRYLTTPLDIPDQVLTDVKSDRARIIFNMHKEGEGFPASQIKLIQNQIRMLNLTNKHVYYMDGNHKTKESLLPHSIKGLIYNFWEAYNGPLDTNAIISDILNKKLRTHKFLSFNNIARDFRAILVHRLITNGIDKNSILTCSDKYQSTPFSMDKDIFKEFEKIKLQKTFPRTFDYELTTSNPTDINVSAHLDSYINICTETFFNQQDDRLFFSEKIFKPIICLQPFILVGQYQSLKYLQNLGFKTFHPYINEAYDQEVNDTLRLSIIVSEVNRLNQLTIDELHNLLLNVLPILEHNACLYRQNYDNNSKEIDTINEIFNTWNMIIENKDASTQKTGVKRWLNDTYTKLVRGST